MSGILLSPRLKPSLAISSGQRITTSTPSIISERCLRIEKRRKRILRVLEGDPILDWIARPTAPALPALSTLASPTI